MMNKIIIITLSLFLTAITLHAQSEGDPLTIVEKMPQFGDCQDEICTQKEIMMFIARNFRYPEASKYHNIEGRVIIEFVVEKDGTVGRVKILIGVHPNLYHDLDKIEEEELRKRLDLNKEELQIWIDNVNNGLNNECIRVISSMPRFSPGKIGNNAVPVKYTVPIMCKLQ